MKKTCVRLYYFHDLDLVTLHRCGQISIGRSVIDALNAEAEGDIGYKIPITSGTERMLPKRERYEIRFSLDEKSKAGKLLSAVELGYRNSFIKMVLRKHLADLSYLYFSGAHPGRPEPGYSISAPNGSTQQDSSLGTAHSGSGTNPVKQKTVKKPRSSVNTVPEVKENADVIENQPKPLTDVPMYAPATQPQTQGIQDLSEDDDADFLDDIISGL